MKVLIIGLGSIAQKHLCALRKLDVTVNIYALRSAPGATKIKGIQNLYNYTSIPDDITFILISNPTSLHKQTIEKVLYLNKPIFLEKPPFMNLSGVSQLLEKIQQQKIKVYTAFNFRFHPLIKWTKQIIDPTEVLEVHAYCGSYLPSWRSQIDYRKNYSAIKALGGGVHLDLIHEIDYIRFLFGLPSKTDRLLRKVSGLEIDSIDSAFYWLHYQNFNVSVCLNYFRKSPKRTLEIVTKEHTLTLDFLKFEATNDDGKVLFSTVPDIQETYDQQMKYFITHLHEPVMNSIDEAVETLKICIDSDEG